MHRVLNFLATIVSLSASDHLFLKINISDFYYISCKVVLRSKLALLNLKCT